MNYSVLKTELQAAQYMALSDTDAAILLNSKTITAKQPIYTHDIKQYMMLSNVWLEIKNSTSDMAVTAMDALKEFDVFTVSNPSIFLVLTNILDGLIADSGIPSFTATHKAAILAMGDKLISKADELGIGSVTAGNVQAARVM